VKIRAGWDETERNAVEIARIVAESGASAVTVHGGRAAAVLRPGRLGGGAERCHGRRTAVVGTATSSRPAGGGAASGVRLCGRDDRPRRLRQPLDFREIAALRRGETPTAPTGEERARVMLKHYRLAPGSTVSAPVST